MKTVGMLRVGMLLAGSVLVTGCASGRCRCGEPAVANAQKMDFKADGPQSGLVAYYPFDGDARDASGHGNDGTAAGNVKYVPGVFGKAAQFGGVDSPGHVHVGNSETLKFGEIMSFSFWVRVEGDATQTWMDCSGRKVDLAGQVVVAKSGDRTGFMIKRGQEGYDKREMDMTAHGHTAKVAGTGSDGNVPLHQWVHVVMIGGKGGTRIYKDGVLAGKDERPMDLSEVNAEDLYVGIQAGKGSCLAYWGPLNGMVDELRIYNRALTDSEVKELARRPEGLAAR